ncbi:MAG: M48 family metallopeptidase [Clostridia bacterium]|nr:M48 family metallopeptidase [Clostridia bacterium]
MIVPDRVIRSKRKTLAVSVDSLGKIIVRAPKSCTDKRIAAFLAEKENWILRHKKRMEEAGVELPSENLDGYRFPILGEFYQIFLTDETRVRWCVEEKKLFLPRSNTEKRLKTWLKENAKLVFERTTYRFAEEMGVEPLSIKIASSRRRWGGCHFNNEIEYTFRLLYAPKEIVDYVVVHELSHILHKDHSKAFWAQVQSVCPDYAKKREWLKSHGALMYIL